MGKKQPSATAPAVDASVDVTAGDTGAEAKAAPSPKKAAQKKEAGQADLGLDKLLKLKVDGVDVPHIREGKVEWIRHTNSNWNEEAQAALFDYWRKRLEEDPSFNVEAKKQKLFHLE